MKRYKPRHKELIDYIDNNEAIEAQVGSTTLISLEDVDIIIDRVKNSVVLADVSVQGEQLKALLAKVVEEFDNGEVSYNLRDEIENELSL